MNSFKDIVASDLHQLMTQSDILLVDVRNYEEVIRGRIEHSVHIPLNMLAENYHLLENKEHVVFYCHSGIRSAIAADFAVSKDIDIKNVYNLQGGVIAWANAGYAFV